MTPTRLAEFDRARCPRLSEMLVRDLPKSLSRFIEIRTIIDKCCHAWNFFANDKTVVASVTKRAWAEVND